MGQILQVSAAMHVLFHMDNPDSLSTTISGMAIEASIDFVELCCQHAAYITGRGEINEEVELMDGGK